MGCNIGVPMGWSWSRQARSDHTTRNFSNNNLIWFNLSWNQVSTRNVHQPPTKQQHEAQCSKWSKTIQMTLSIWTHGTPCWPVNLFPCICSPFPHICSGRNTWTSSQPSLQLKGEVEHDAWFEGGSFHSSFLFIFPNISWPSLGWPQCRFLCHLTRPKFLPKPATWKCSVLDTWIMVEF